MPVQVTRLLTRLLPVLALIGLTACGSPPQMAGRSDIEVLRQGILDLGPEIDPEEAARAARISYDYTHQLAVEYEITDAPLIHNSKVNMGLKPRGLCWHWAEDMENRLKAENFRTLEIHRAIANAHNPMRIDHSTAIVSRRGDSLFEGIVLDPWRKGGELTWVPTNEDKYKWVPQRDAHAILRAQKLAAGEELPSRADLPY